MLNLEEMQYAHLCVRIAGIDYNSMRQGLNLAGARIYHVASMGIYDRGLMFAVNRTSPSTSSGNYPIRAAFCNGSVVFPPPLEDKLRLTNVKYEETWKENQV